MNGIVADGLTGLEKGRVSVQKTDAEATGIVEYHLRRGEPMNELEALRSRVSELEQYEKYYRQTRKDFGQGGDRSIPSMPFNQEAVFVIFDRRFEFVNDQFAELFGVTTEEACESNFDPMTLIAPEDHGFIWGIYRQGCCGTFKTKQLHFTGMTKNGQKITCETFLLFIHYKWGLAVQGTLRSISLDSADKIKKNFII
jgi:PAS domain-containing protein